MSVKTKTLEQRIKKLEIIIDALRLDASINRYDLSNVYSRSEEIEREEGIESAKSISPESWHTIYVDPMLGNLTIGKKGSLYILDKNKRALTRGYHKLWIKKGVLYGSIGSYEERVRPSYEEILGANQ